MFDLGADGLKAKRDEGTPFDTWENGKSLTSFDGEWKKQKMSEEDYMKAFSAADEKYSTMLNLLLGALKKKSS